MLSARERVEPEHRAQRACANPTVAWLNGEPLPTPAATAAQHLTPARRSHALQKAVIALARDALGLIGPLWHD